MPRYPYLESHFTENGFSFGREDGKSDYYNKGEHQVEICKPCKLFTHKMNGLTIKILNDTDFSQYVEYIKTIR